MGKGQFHVSHVFTISLCASKYDKLKCCGLMIAEKNSFCLPDKVKKKKIIIRGKDMHTRQTAIWTPTPLHAQIHC